MSQHDIDRVSKICDVGSKPGVRLDATSALSVALGKCAMQTDFISVLGLNTEPTRLVAFNKSSASNWSVPWHQDRVIAVRERIDCDGFHSWVPKSGFWHCEPPTSLLENMVFARIHFDAAGKSNGALELALGTHKRGYIPSKDAAKTAETAEVEVCHAEPGDILIVKALTLHRSRSAKISAPRRALRLDYAVRAQLSDRLAWAIA